MKAKPWLCDTRNMDPNSFCFSFSSALPSLMYKKRGTKRKSLREPAAELRTTTAFWWPMDFHFTLFQMHLLMALRKVEVSLTPYVDNDPLSSSINFEILCILSQVLNFSMCLVYGGKPFGNWWNWSIVRLVDSQETLKLHCQINCRILKYIKDTHPHI